MTQRGPSDHHSAYDEIYGARVEHELSLLQSEPVITHVRRVVLGLGSQVTPLPRVGFCSNSMARPKPEPTTVVPNRADRRRSRKRKP